jgi:hypothetical protein
MEVRLGFNPEAELWSEPALAGLSGDADISTEGPTVPLSEAQVSAEPRPISHGCRGGGDGGGDRYRSAPSA